MQVEQKITLTTTEVEGHTHERFFEDGTIPAGTYRTSEGGVNDHIHFFVIEEDVQPGDSVTVTTSPPDGEDEGHQHRLTARAVAPESDTSETDRGRKPERDRNNPRRGGYKSMSQKFETKQIGGHVVEHKEIERDGVRLGVIEALIATWEPDAGGIFGVPDQFVPGAFAESILEHRARGNRQVRLKDHHGRTIGGFPIENVRETASGLFGVGEINLETQQGAEVWALIKQGVLVDMSVGFSSREDTIENGLRVISKAILWEGSVVDEPANRGANILSFKATPFADLPIAPAAAAWDPIAARARVEKLAATQRVEMKTAFVQEGDDGTVLDLQIADVVDDTLVVVPQAVQEAADKLIGAEGAAPVIEHLERYFAKMGAPSPFPIEQRRFFGAQEARELKPADLERALTNGAVFSAKAAKAMAARLTAGDGGLYDGGKIARILKSLEEAKRELKGR